MPEPRLIEFERDKRDRIVGVRVVVPKRRRVPTVAWVRVGDEFRKGHMRVRVKGFRHDGTGAFVDRTTSRRKQAISTARLVADYERVRSS